MSSYIDLKFINDISSRLTLFKKKGDYFNFRCPHCGDSKKNKTKKLFYRVKNDMFFKMQLWYRSISSKLYKVYHPKLYDLYLLETATNVVPST